MCKTLEIVLRDYSSTVVVLMVSRQTFKILMKPILSLSPFMMFSFAIVKRFCYVFLSVAWFCFSHVGL